MKSGSAGPRLSNHPWLNQQPYCLSETTTLSTSCPSASLPLKVEVRVFPSLETFEVTVMVTWPPFFIVDSIVSAPTRFTETMSGSRCCNRQSESHQQQCRCEYGIPVDSHVLTSVWGCLDGPVGVDVMRGNSRKVQKIFTNLHGLRAKARGSQLRTIEYLSKRSRHHERESR